MSKRNEQAEFVIDDPEELSQKTRISELLQRRKEVLEARNASKDEELLGDVSHIDAISHYQTHIETLILDLWTKFYDTAEGEKYLDKIQIADVQVPPPREIPTGNDLAPGASVPDPETVTIRGLRWFVENEPIVQASFSVRGWNPPTEQTYTNATVLDRSVLDRAVSRCFEFMNEVGIDADFDDEGEPIIRHFDQSDPDDPNAELGEASYSGDPDI